VPATLQQFAAVNDAAAATTRKLQKQAILGEYFRALDEKDLRLAVRFASGRAFAATDERVLGVGGSLVWDVTISLVGLDPREFHDLIVRSGEIGEALSKVWKPLLRGTGFQPERAAQDLETILQYQNDHHGLQTRATLDAPAELALRDLAEAFNRLAATGVVEQKRAILLDLLTRCQSGREAAYLCKIIFGDLRTGVQEGVLQAAIAVAFEKPLAQIQRCQLLVGDLDEVVVLAKNNALEVAQFRLFHPIQFMLATAQDTAEIAAKTMAGRTFFAEDKLDGIRAQIHKSGDRIAIYTRTMDRTDESFPEVVQMIRTIPGDFLLDGEIVPYRDGRVLPFAHLQRRLGRKKLTPRMLSDNPMSFIAFDLLYLNGHLLMECPLRQRSQQLNEIAASSGLLVTSRAQVSTADQISETFAAARDRRNEGIVLKDPESCYSPGRRGKAWLKLKTHLPTFDCVVTAAEYGNGKRRNVLSDYTFAVWSAHPHDPEARLLNVGKAYSGVTDEEIAQLTELFLSIARQQIGRVFLVEPKIVLEVAADQIQKSDRHESGYALRFPRIKRIRWDKTPDQADRIERIIEVYDSAHNFGRQEQKQSQPEPTLFD